MEYVLTSSNLCKSYGQHEVLHDVSMHIPKGSIYGFVGKNGAGKTTFIRLICGLQKPSSGGYSIYGIENSDKTISKSRQRMGGIVETPALYLDMSATQNLKQQALLLGLPSYESIPKLLKLVGLEDTGTKKAGNFSLGMKQRLGIAIALLGNPDFLILDEPINGLDPQGIVEIRELILKLNREYQITVLISSHILDELSRLATHYGFIDKGHLLKEISAKELEALYRKSILVEVTDTTALSHVLEAEKLEYEILSDTSAKIYGTVNLSQLVLRLLEQNCELISANEQDESLENYFINLIGGDRHE